MILYLSTFTVLAFYTLRIRAQNVTDVPQCAQQAAGTSISSTGCQLTDISCICKSQSFLQSFLPAIDKACSQEDVEKTITFAQSFCGAASISLTLPAASTTGSTPTAVNTAVNTTGTTISTASRSGEQTATTTNEGSPTVASTAATGTTRSSGADGLSKGGWWTKWVWVWMWIGVWIGWV